MTLDLLHAIETWGIAVSLVGLLIFAAGLLGCRAACRRWERNAPIAMAVLTPDDPALPAEPVDPVDERMADAIVLLDLEPSDGAHWGSNEQGRRP